MAFSRKQETILLLSMLILSIVGLVLVMHFEISPNIPHQEQVPLKLHPNCQIMKIETWKVLQPDHPISKQHKDEVAGCWLSIQILVDMTAGYGKSFTTYIDLPYGNLSVPYTDACMPARQFKEVYPADEPIVPLWIDVKDQNNAYFNVSTGSNDFDWSTTYDPNADPPTLVIMRSVGQGVTIGGGFMLTVCIILFILPVAGFALRFWDDRRKADAINSLNDDGSAREARLAAVSFAPLEEASESDAEEVVRREQPPPSEADVHIERDVNEIELQESKYNS